MNVDTRNNLTNEPMNFDRSLDGKSFDIKRIPYRFEGGQLLKGDSPNSLDPRGWVPVTKGEWSSSTALQDAVNALHSQDRITFNFSRTGEGWRVQDEKSSVATEQPKRKARNPL